MNFSEVSDAFRGAHRLSEGFRAVSGGPRASLMTFGRVSGDLKKRFKVFQENSGRLKGLQRLSC